MQLQEATTDGLIFETGRGEEKLIILPCALQTIFGHQQTNASGKEAGGMLFAMIRDDVVVVEEVTAPRGDDRRSRYWFWPSLKHQQRTINRQFAVDLHFIGEWHTHPERDPTPSSLDLKSMSDCFALSKHELSGLVMLILGTGKTIDALWVSLHTANQYSRLIPRLLFGGKADGLFNSLE